jgi:hypothetical protein
MKVLRIFLLVTVVTLFGVGCGRGIEDSEVPKGYSLVWNDEFDTENSLPEDEWRFETGKTGWGNNEQQNYTAGLGEDAAALVEGGILKITAKKWEGEIISARINTRKSRLYGYFEARLKLPRGRGTWPAFWMLPEDFVNFPDNGEIDTMEAAGYDPDWVHTGETGKNAKKNIPAAQSDFHVYAVEWTPGFIKGYADGELYFEKDAPMSRRFGPAAKPGAGIFPAAFKTGRALNAAFTTSDTKAVRYTWCGEARGPCDRWAPPGIRRTPAG